MTKLLTKVARGVAFGDVSNIGVRNILTEISKRNFDKIDDTYIRDMEAFFGNKCPYTGKDLTILKQQNKIATDHIVPQNRDMCGLNVPGNLILVDKDANHKKGQMTVEDFLLNDNEFFAGVPIEERKHRLAKIKEFQAKYNYDPDYIKGIISKILNDIYSKIREQQEKWIDEINGMLPNSKKVFEPDQSVKIGSIVQHEFFDVLMNGKVSKDEILRLQDPKYSNETFGITTFPVLSKTKIFAKGARTYSKPITIFGESYYVCNDWHEKSRDKVIEYINRYY